MAEVIIPVEVMVPSACLVLVSELSGPNNHIYDVKALEKKGQSEENKWLFY